ncbi:MAG: hypothetical protein L3J59_00465 [Methylococcaceae bacterium]|nr:hypothetical protein [Methylococcaceae bacterium]
MLQTSRRNNVCTFVVSLKHSIKLSELELYLSNNPAYQWITRLRIKKGLPFSLVKWVFDKTLALPEIKQFQNEKDEAVVENLLATTIRIESQSPFKVDLIQVSGARSILVFTWHHVLMDAHGGESFIRALGMNQSIDFAELLAEEQTKLPLGLRANIAQEMKTFLHETSQLPLFSLYKKPAVKQNIASLNYRVISFTEQQTLKINETARNQGASFLLSAFYLAATTCSVAHIQQLRGPVEGDVLVPIPLDRRKRGVDKPIIGNQVTFLFYRIPQKVLSDVQGCTTELISQMKTLMRTDSPKHYLIMMDFLRHIPGFFYRLMLKSPTKGLMASFFYSDTGDSLQRYDQLFDRSVESAIHYPPTMYPPGLTFVFSRFRGSLQITLGYMEQVIGDKEVDQLFKHLRSVLLGTVNNE